jgi:hypothetical protein
LSPGFAASVTGNSVNSHVDFSTASEKQALVVVECKSWRVLIQQMTEAPKATTTSFHYLTSLYHHPDPFVSMSILLPPFDMEFRCSQIHFMVKLLGKQVRIDLGCRGRFVPEELPNRVQWDASQDKSSRE